VVSISKITRKFANHENVSAIFLEPTIFIFLSIILEIDLDTSKPWCLVYKRRPLSIICLGWTTCVNKQPPATPADLNRECPADITYGGSSSVARPPSLPRRIRNARRPIIHEVPPLSATGRVTLRCCRRGATAAIKGTVRSRAPGIHAPPLRLACDFPAADWLGIIATSSSSSSAPLPPIPASPSLATSTKAAIPRASKSAMPKWLPSTDRFHSTGPRS
jgi:hypothetical protein